MSQQISQIRDELLLHVSMETDPSLREADGSSFSFEGVPGKRVEGSRDGGVNELKTA